MDRDLVIRVVLLLDAPGTFDVIAWQAIGEAAALYEVHGGWLEVSELASSEVRLTPVIDAVYLGREPMEGAESALPPERVEELLRLVEVQNSVKEAPRRGRSSSSLVDAMALVGHVGEAVGARGPCVVVHDRPLQPPPDLRYVIWNPVPGGVAVSSAALDPAYWGERADDSQRIDAVRRRLRAALCSVLGSTIGLLRCDNPTCFLFANVSRVTSLDAMVHIGPEHGAPALTGRGFTSAGNDPTQTAEVVMINDPGPA